jgi:four helix bundle protein
MSNEIAEQLKERTLRFALRAMRFCKTLPDSWEARFIADQLFRAATRTAANYRSTCRARSHREFISKMGTVVEESDESFFWLMLIGRSGMNETADQKELLGESRELLAIFIQSAKTASGR